jgi:hypothetical protein
MRRFWYVVISLAIIGGAAALEIWSSRQFPLIEFDPGRLPLLAVGLEREYDYFKNENLAGSYVFWIESKAPYNGRIAYFTGSRTTIEYRYQSIELETFYVFSEELAPLEYSMNASIDGEDRLVTCSFDGLRVDTLLALGEDMMEKSEELPEGTVLIEYYMLAHWDLLLKTFPPVPGRRFVVNVYIPQVLTYKPLDVLTDPKPKSVRINTTAYECTVVRVPQLNLVLYRHEGDVIKFEDVGESVVISIRG